MLLTSAMSSPNAVPPKPTPKERLTRLWQEYGTLALVVFAVLWVGTLFSIWTAVKLGWRPQTATG
ncbi:MAG: hypothetical protein ACK4N5_23150, partial [Myxococcales bacterium]